MSVRKRAQTKPVYRYDSYPDAADRDGRKITPGCICRAKGYRGVKLIFVGREVNRVTGAEWLVFSTVGRGTRCIRAEDVTRVRKGAK